MRIPQKHRKKKGTESKTINKNKKKTTTQGITDTIDELVERSRKTNQFVTECPRRTHKEKYGEGCVAKKFHKKGENLINWHETRCNPNRSGKVYIESLYEMSLPDDQDKAYVLTRSYCSAMSAKLWPETKANMERRGFYYPNIEVNTKGKTRNGQELQRIT
ncbi:MAG: hypothetical protein GY795_45715 [Desulfobacterales bacterium]|nr:hypothetical protein [Desulfobacterales bacterium]